MYDAVGGPWQWTDRLGWDAAPLARAPRAPRGRDVARATSRASRSATRSSGAAATTSSSSPSACCPGFPGRGLGGALLAAATRATRGSAGRGARLAAHVLARLPRGAALVRAARLPPLRRARPDERWVVDASNVIGSRPDGWWRDRAGRGAAARRRARPLRRRDRRAGRSVVLDAGEPPAGRARRGRRRLAAAAATPPTTRSSRCWRTAAARAPASSPRTRSWPAGCARSGRRSRAPGLPAAARLAGRPVRLEADVAALAHRPEPDPLVDALADGSARSV